MFNVNLMWSIHYSCLSDVQIPENCYGRSLSSDKLKDLVETYFDQPSYKQEREGCASHPNSGAWETDKFWGFLFISQTHFFQKYIPFTDLITPKYRPIFHILIIFFMTYVFIKNFMPSCLASLCITFSTTYKGQISNKY